MDGAGLFIFIVGLFGGYGIYRFIEDNHSPYDCVKCGKRKAWRKDFDKCHQCLKAAVGKD